MNTQPGRFVDKVVLVVGATSGIGERTAEAFAAEGAMVVAAGRRQEKGDAVADIILSKGGKVIFMPVDVRDPESIAQLFAQIALRFGRLDAAFNNAGCGGDNLKRTEEHSVANWDLVMDTNLKGVWLCMKHELAAIAQTGGGAIVNTTSIFAQVGSDLGIAPYVASKHGVLGLTRAAAIEYARLRIRINAVAPGFTRTEMTEPALRFAAEEFNRQVDRHVPMGRLAEPEEIARAVLWLCSNEAQFVTGTNLTIDGGWLAK